MKIHTIIKPIITIFVTVSIASAVNAEAAKKVGYTYGGDDLARSVCKSIVEDNATKLKRLLRREQTVTRALRPIDTNVFCNSKNLYDFAVEVDATKSRAFLLKQDKFRSAYQETGSDRKVASK